MCDCVRVYVRLCEYIFVFCECVSVHVCFCECVCVFV